MPSGAAATTSSAVKPAPLRPKPSKARAVPVFEQDSDDDQDSLDLPSDQTDSNEPSDDEDEEDDEGDSESEQGSIAAYNDDDQGERRFAQFVDEDELEEGEDDSDDSDDDDDDDEDGSDRGSQSGSDVSSDEESEGAAHRSGSATRQRERQLREQMKNIPFSALVKARQQLRNDSEGSDSDDASIGLSDLEPDEFEADRQRLASAKAGKKAIRGGAAHRGGHDEKGGVDDEDDELQRKRDEVKQRLRQLKSRDGPAPDSDDGEHRAHRRRAREEREFKELDKRANKHAPTEMSSRRPVSRRRNVIETASSKVRDPRFDSLSAGAANADLFAKSYSFLPELLSNELQTLKSAHGKLRKQEAHQAGPKAKSEVATNLRAERERVEMALRRAEGLAGERERRHREAELKRKLKRQNKDRVEQGLQPFYVKKSEQRAMLLKEKYDQLAGTSNEGASGDSRKSLRKALERRRKKNVQKERKDMPVGMALGLSGAATPKRKRDAGEALTSAGPGRSGGKQRASREGGAPARKRGRRG